MLKDLCTLPSDLYRNRRLVKKMAKNDLKSRFAGSYFGTIWAFIQPIVTILVYYFVFGIAMRGGAASGDGTPFVLYLVSGIVPWMYFQEGLITGTNSFLEYKPVYQNDHDRLDHCPYHAKIGTCISGLEIILCQLPDQLPVGPEIS